MIFPDLRAGVRGVPGRGPRGNLEILGNTGCYRTGRLDISLATLSDNARSFCGTYPDTNRLACDLFYKSWWIPPVVLPGSGGTPDNLKILWLLKPMPLRLHIPCRFYLGFDRCDIPEMIGLSTGAGYYPMRGLFKVWLCQYQHISVMVRIKALKRWLNVHHWALFQQSKWSWSGADVV